MQRAILILATALFCLAPAAMSTNVTFYMSAPGAGQVYLAGTFNGWSANTDLMVDENGDGVFSITVGIDPGDHMYKFVIDDVWKEDPHAADYADDGHGGRNGIVKVTGDEMEVGQKVAGEKPAEKKVVPKKILPKGTQAVTVRFEPKIGGVNEIYIAGSFNDWAADKYPMTDPDGDGVYEIILALAKGEHLYKFVVDGNWMADENAEDFVDDGFGGQNSILRVGSSSDEGMKMRRVPFIFETDKDYGAVYLAGTFNDWNPGKTLMEKGEGKWTLTMLMPPGEHAYKFVADGNWITDRDGADTFIDDGHGGENSVIQVDGRFEGVDRKVGDGKIEEGAIRFSPEFPDLNRSDPSIIEVNFRTAAGDVESVDIVVDGKTKAMRKAASDAAEDLWRADVPVLDDNISLAMSFLIHDGDKTTVYGFQGVGGGPIRVRPGRLETFYTPAWVADGIFYQIFPDRFFNGDKSNDPDFSEEFYKGINKLPSSGKTNDEYFHMEENWNDYRGLTRSRFRTDGKPDYYSFYGGDMEGVRQKLDYLVDLGVSIIYFNPVTLGKSNHKYDAGDYMTLDPHFGSKEDWKRFIAEAHDKGIRVVVEAVYNHCGDTHWAFQDCVKKGPDSEYWKWYEWKNWPLPEQGSYEAINYYDCWWGFGLHPNLNFDNTRIAEQENGLKNIEEADPNWPVVNHLLDTTEFWLTEMDVDGFRMDVPNEVPFWFWKLFRERVRSIKPDAYLVGELWSTAPEWVGNETFDAVMNYRHFKDPVNNWIGNGRGNAQSFEAGLAPGRTAYPSQAVRVMMNLIDSHDTVRFITTADGDRRRLKLAALFQMSYLGAPHIWYGDEIGMEGQRDPDCRRPFYWNFEEDPGRVEMREFYKSVTHLRRDNPALRRGDFRLVLAKGKDYAFMREDPADAFLVVMHNTQDPENVVVNLGELGYADGTDFGTAAGTRRDLVSRQYTVEGGKILLKMEAYEGVILKKLK
jgi:cyclomaltodextrinase / maltogenic alpha-amylase / neopullulanase